MEEESDCEDADAEEIRKAESSAIKQLQLVDYQLSPCLTDSAHLLRDMWGTAFVHISED